MIFHRGQRHGGSFAAVLVRPEIAKEIGCKKVDVA